MRNEAAMAGASVVAMGIRKRVWTARRTGAQLTMLGYPNGAAEQSCPSLGVTRSKLAPMSQIHGHHYQNDKQKRSSRSQPAVLDHGPGRRPADVHPTTAICVTPATEAVNKRPPDCRRCRSLSYDSGVSWRQRDSPQCRHNNRSGQSSAWPGSTCGGLVALGGCGPKSGP